MPMQESPKLKAVLVWGQRSVILGTAHGHRWCPHVARQHPPTRGYYFYATFPATIFETHLFSFVLDSQLFVVLVFFGKLLNVGIFKH